MTQTQYISNATFTGAPPNTQVTQLNPTGAGVNFTAPNGSVVIRFAPGISPYVDQVFVASPLTNVISIRVILTSPDGEELVNQLSPSGTNKVTGLSTIQLPENSTVTIIFYTANNEPPQNVTVSIIACFEPSTATTIVTSGSTAPTVTSSPTTLTFSSVTSGTSQTLGKE